jgi:DNA repair ATPase RecN
VRTLQGGEREKEIAGMLGVLTEQTLGSAREMLLASSAAKQT